MPYDILCTTRCTPSASTIFHFSCHDRGPNKSIPSEKLKKKAAAPPRISASPVPETGVRFSQRTAGDAQAANSTKERDVDEENAINLLLLRNL